MRSIAIDTDVFALIWSLRKAGEETENEILRRVLSDISNHSEPENDASLPGSSESEPKRPESMFSENKEVKNSNATPYNPRNKEVPMGKIRWVDDVTEALRGMGGKGFLSSIYTAVERRRRGGGRSVPPSLEATVRRTLEDFSSDSANFRGEDLFQNTGRGEWAIRSR